MSYHIPLLNPFTVNETQQQLYSKSIPWFHSKMLLLVNFSRDFSHPILPSPRLRVPRHQREGLGRQVAAPPRRRAGAEAQPRVAAGGEVTQHLWERHLRWNPGGFQAIYGKSWKISPLVVETWWKNRGKSPNLSILDISGKKESISCHLYNGFKGSFSFGQRQICPPSVHSSLCQSLWKGAWKLGTPKYHGLSKCSLSKPS